MFPVAFQSVRLFDRQSLISDFLQLCCSEWRRTPNNAYVEQSIRETRGGLASFHQLSLFLQYVILTHCINITQHPQTGLIDWKSSTNSIQGTFVHKGNDETPPFLGAMCATRDIRRKGWQKSRHQGTSIHIHHQHSKKRILRPRRRSVFNVGTYRAAVQSQQAKLWTTTIKFKCRFTCLQSFYDLLSWNKSLCFKGNRDDTGMTQEWKKKIGR